MTSNNKKELLLEMKNIHIDGFSDERWHKILKGVDLNLYRGEILGLIGESGAGKSTMGKAAMGYTQPGCKINGIWKKKNMGYENFICCTISCSIF